MEEQPEEIKFPLHFTVCPNCGSTRFVANEVLKKEKEKGKISPNIQNAFLFSHNSAILDATRTVLSAPVIVTFFDSCADCGTVVAVHTELKTGVPGVQQAPPTQYGQN